MTTYMESSVVCGACGHVFTWHQLASTNTDGSPDLDTRPAEMQRSTMHAWIQRCPSCSFCACDVAKFDERFREVMTQPAYKSQLADSRYPNLTSTFICAAILAESIGERAGAGWNYLHAAWTLDDAEKGDLARVCRGKAADIFLAILTEGRPFVQQPGASEALVTDCLRRAGRGPEALKVIESVLNQDCNGVIRRILTFQRTLIERGNTSRHLIAETDETTTHDAANQTILDGHQRGWRKRILRFFGRNISVVCALVGL